MGVRSADSVHVVLNRSTAAAQQKMTQVIWVDSRVRVSGLDSDFEVSLRESVHLSDARVRIDKLCFSDSFLTTDGGQNLYFLAPGGGFSSVSVPQGAYTGFSLAGAIQGVTGRDHHACAAQSKRAVAL